MLNISQSCCVQVPNGEENNQHIVTPGVRDARYISISHNNPADIMLKCYVSRAGVQLPNGEVTGHHVMLKERLNVI